MIALIFGENDFLRCEVLNEKLAGRAAERHNADGLMPAQLEEHMSRQSLFDDVPPLVVYGAAQNKELWQFLEQYQNAPRDIFFVDEKVDKRTKTYKNFKQKQAVYECAVLKREYEVVQWLQRYAKERYGVMVEKKYAEMIVARLGVEQGRIAALMWQLQFVDEINEERILALVPMLPSENVFALFEAVLKRDRESLHKIILYLEMHNSSDEAYRTLGLLVSQLFNMTALNLAGGDVARVSKDFSAHEFTLRQLLPHVRSVDREKLANWRRALAAADLQMKQTAVNPWTILEAALMDMTK